MRIGSLPDWGLTCGADHGRGSVPPRVGSHTAGILASARAVLQLLSSCLWSVKGTDSKEVLFLTEQMLCSRVGNVWPGHMSRAHKGPPGTEKHEGGLFLPRTCCLRYHMKLAGGLCLELQQELRAEHRARDSSGISPPKSPSPCF